MAYLHVVGQSDATAPPPEHYAPWSKRFIDSYHKFKDDVPHNLIVVHCGGPVSKEGLSLFPDGTWHISYRGGGWDIGAHQHCLKTFAGEFEYIICMATPVYFWRTGFIERMVEARTKFGDGLYGPTASYENRPHIRTCCWAVTPQTFAQYPEVIDTRAKTFRAESGDLSIVAWYEARGLPQIMVAADGFYTQADWRKPDNVFRRGTQENCLVRDRHTDLYDAADTKEKLELSNRADAKNYKVH